LFDMAQTQSAEIPVFELNPVGAQECLAEMGYEDVVTEGNGFVGVFGALPDGENIALPRDEYQRPIPSAFDVGGMIVCRREVDTDGQQSRMRVEYFANHTIPEVAERSVHGLVEYAGMVAARRQVRVVTDVRSWAETSTEAWVGAA
jgi:hypothetical protein